MRCHYTYDKEAGRVWIPGCWGGVHGPEWCICKTSITTFQQYEKGEYNKLITEKNEKIKELENEVFRLERLIKNLLNSDIQNNGASPMSMPNEQNPDNQK